MVRFYDKTGTAEQWIKDVKQAAKTTPFSCPRASVLLIMVGTCSDTHYGRSLNSDPIQRPGKEIWPCSLTSGRPIQ